MLGERTAFPYIFYNTMNRFAINLIIVLLSCLLVGCKKDVYDIDMIYIAGGTYMMGCDDETADPDEQPVHSVTVKDFYIGKYEITQEQWKTVMRHDPAYHRALKYPVEDVSWDDCQKFIQKLNSITGKNYRLPTEEEWEYVASISYKNIKKEDLTSYAWCRGSYGERTRKNITSQKVGSLKPDIWGIYDIIGNVNEWCSNSYDSLSYQNGFSQESDEKVFKGGCFANEENYLRPTNRNHIDRHTRHYTLGLRLAMDANIQ